MNAVDARVAAFLAELEAAGTLVLPFYLKDAEAAVTANAVYGSRGGLGGPLNMLDLMVYGVARARGLPILCTGKDFTKTDALIHPASRRDP